ncbi:50S ribosomal protein L6 [Candidatus Woesearchaeota archaeon CG_4_10_14_0_8_um_filter_47_5]|nr:MAG: 50S ribosomal protein L6 [Candidatus Woesearchaeota archaeon CG_4_10_14_0_8_um_filter_47_5]
MEKAPYENTIEVPEGVSVAVENSVLSIKGPKGEVRRDFRNPSLSLTHSGNALVLSSSRSTKREKKLVGTYVAHINNLLAGVKEPFTYVLHICSGHFPMNVSVQNNVLSVKNFFGEKVPRTLKIKNGVDVKVQGTDITVTSPDIEFAGQTAADIERLSRRTKGFDLRVFQDGIYIVHKPKRNTASQ